MSDSGVEAVANCHHVTYEFLKEQDAACEECVGKAIAAHTAAAVQGWKDMADKEHALAVEFASKNVDLTAQLAARQTWIDEYAKQTEAAIQQRDEAWTEFDDLTARLASMTRTLEGRICEVCWGSNWSPVPPSEEHPEGRRCDHCWLTARLAAADKERELLKQTLDNDDLSLYRAYEDLAVERNRLTAALAQAAQQATKFEADLTARLAAAEEKIKSHEKA